MRQHFKYFLHVAFSKPVTEQQALETVHKTIGPRDCDNYTVADVVGIHEGAKFNRFKTALGVQDGGNLRALAREFVRVVDNADEELRSTKEVWDDPAVVLFVNKFESLTRSDARFSAAYKACQEKANG